MNVLKLTACGLLILLPAVEICYSIDSHRIARYTMEFAVPSQAQTDLLSTTVKTKFPAQVATVEAAINYILLRSGYSFLVTEEIRKTLALPLPYVHREIGPLDLRTALQTLTGESWKLQEDPRERVVWFQLTGSDAEPPNANPDLDSIIDFQVEPSIGTKSLESESTESETVNRSGSWTLLPQKTLRNNLSDWSKQANWNLQWNSRHDYDVYHRSTYDGSFFEAVQEVLEHYKNASVPLAASFYEGNSVLVIEPLYSLPATQ